MSQINKVQAVVTTDLLHNNETVDSSTKEDDVCVKVFETTPAIVGVDYGITINLGNYESARVNISLQFPCYKEEIDDAYDFASKWVEDRINTETKLIRGSKNKDKGL